MPYQTLGDGHPGDSDSHGKWQALRLPSDAWDEAAVLDLGCNAGYFCRQAVNSGAGFYCGVDRSPELIAEACRRFNYPQSIFINSDWSGVSFESKKFDVILLLSSLHYVDDVPGILSRIRAWLTDSGVFVLECGVASGPGSRWVLADRSGSRVVYPTVSLLETLLRRAGLSCRHMGPSVAQRGDPVPRFVFHCRRMLPHLLIVSGPSGSGKTSVCRDVQQHSFSVDEHLRDWVRMSGQKWFPAEAAAGNLQSVYDRIVSDDTICAEFVASILRSIASRDLVVVDCIDVLADQLREAASCHWKVWTASSREMSGA